MVRAKRLSNQPNGRSRIASGPRIAMARYLHSLLQSETGILIWITDWSVWQDHMPWAKPVR
jgi:hypothetical protein